MKLILATLAVILTFVTIGNKAEAYDGCPGQQRPHIVCPPPGPGGTSVCYIVCR